jgi:hypothetical protein
MLSHDRIHAPNPHRGGGVEMMHFIKERVLLKIRVCDKESQFRFNVGEEVNPRLVDRPRLAVFTPQTVISP